MSQGTSEPSLVLVALGANLPADDQSPTETVRQAIRALQARYGAVTPSRLYRSPAFPAGAGPDYINAAVRFATLDNATEVLAALHQIEADLGRTRRERWASRLIDLDLLAHGQQVLPDLDAQAAWRDMPLAQQLEQVPQQLVLPHPRLQDRAFVLKPLQDIAADWRHPVLGQSVDQMLARLSPAQIDPVVPIVQG